MSYEEMIKYYDCLSLFLSYLSDMQIVSFLSRISVLSDCTVFFNITSWTLLFYFGKSYWTKNLFGFSIQLLFETILFLRRFQPDIIINHIDFHVNHTSFLSHLTKRMFSRQILERALSNFMKIRPMRVEFFLAGRQTEWRTNRYTYACVCVCVCVCGECNSLFCKFWEIAEWLKW